LASKIIQKPKHIKKQIINLDQEIKNVFLEFIDFITKEIIVFPILCIINLYLDLVNNILLKNKFKENI